MKYECPCGYVYDPALGDPENGVAPGTAWEDVPEDWVCPTCGLGKDAIHDTVHEMAKDEARHGRALKGLLERYFK